MPFKYTVKWVIFNTVLSGIDVFFFLSIIFKFIFFIIITGRQIFQMQSWFMQLCQFVTNFDVVQILRNDAYSLKKKIRKIKIL